MPELDTAKISEKLRFKKNLLLHCVRRSGQIGRLEMARRLRLSNSRVCEIIQEMLDEGLLLEEWDGTDRRGRLPVPVRVNPDYGHFVGFDMEAMRLRLVVVDFSGNTVWQAREKRIVSEDRQELIERVLGFIDEGLKKIRPHFRRIQGIGLAAPGVVDVRQGVILHYDLEPAARDIPLRDLVASRTGLHCVLEDNIRALTLAEWVSGAAQHLSTFVCLAVRSGVGAGMVFNGRLYFGSHGFSGEASRLVVPSEANPSQWRTLEKIVSETALGVDAEAGEVTIPKGKAERVGQILGAQLASIVAFLDPEAIVLAGKLIQPDGPLWEPIEKTFRRFVLPDVAGRVQLLPARLGPFAAAIGAAHRSFENLYPVERSSL